MTNKIVAWVSELTGYYDRDGEWIEPDKPEDLVQEALNHKLPEEENMTVEELIFKKEKELTQLTIRHNEIVEYQNDNPSFYHNDEELSELLDSIEEKMNFIVKLKREVT